MEKVYYLSKVRLHILFLMASLFGSQLLSAAPYELSYGGRLAEQSGKPVEGPVDLYITFYRSATGDDAISSVIMPAITNVVLNEGVFQVKLSLSAADFHTIFNGTDEAWIQVTDLTHTKTYPRQKFSAVPYALKVPVNGSSITYNANGELTLGNGSHFLTLPNSAGAANKILKSDGAGGLIWDDDLNGGGVGSVSSAEIQDGAIANIDVSNSAAISTSKLSGAVTAIANHGLGDSAGKNVGTAAGTVAAGDHGHSAATTSAAGFMSAADKTKLDGISAGAAPDTNAQTICADGEYLRGEDGSAVCKTAADIVADGSGVKTTDTGTVTSTMVSDGTIKNDDINASAAISGSKIAPNFGAQNIATTGSVQGGNISASGYLQTGTVGGAPAGGDCDDPTEHGRLRVDTTNNRLYVCSTTGWVLAANNAGGLLSTNNLSDVGDQGLARNNLGLGTMATKSAVGSSDITDGTIENGDISNGAAISTSKLSGAVTAIANHGLGDSAGKNVGTAAGTVAAGDHSHSAATTSAAGFMSAADKTKLDGIASGAGVDTNTKTLCLDGEFLRGEDSTTCKTSAEIVTDGNGVKTSDTGTVTGTMIAGTTIANANISTTAAIAGTKISPDFGSQNIASTGNLNIANITASGTISGNGSGLTNLPTVGTSGGAASNPSSGCPTGYILVPGDSAFGTTDFCVMKYEAKFGKKGAESRASGLPARRSVAQADAISYCRNLGPGYALLNNSEWMTIATNIGNVASNWSGGTVGSGALNRGHTDNAPADALAASTDDNAACTGTGQTCSSSVWDSQRRTHTLSNGNVIWDFAGNVWEWVDYYNDEDKPGNTAAWVEYSALSGTTTMPKSELVPTNAVKAWWSDSWNSTQNIGQIYPGTNGSGGALRRGGNWDAGTRAGVFTASLNYAPSNVDAHIGFRCGWRKAQ